MDDDGATRQRKGISRFDYCWNKQGRVQWPTEIWPFVEICDTHSVIVRGTIDVFALGKTSVCPAETQQQSKKKHDDEKRHFIFTNTKRRREKKRNSRAEIWRKSGGNQPFSAAGDSAQIRSDKKRNAHKKWKNQSPRKSFVCQCLSVVLAIVRPHTMNE